MSVPQAATPERTWPRFIPVADHAVLVGFGEVITDDTSAAVQALDRALAAAPPLGFRECVPALVNLLIEFDPLLTDHEQIRDAVRGLLQDVRVKQDAGRLREVEICYEGGFAPDLDSVAKQSGISVEAVIELHLQGDYRVRMYGFAPGYAYMSGVPQAIQAPRKVIVARDVPVGSVLTAGPQCLVSTLIMPTGWNIIGRSPTRILTGDERAPFLFEVGDRVRFKRIDLAQYEARTPKEPHE